MGKVVDKQNVVKASSSGSSVDQVLTGGQSDAVLFTDPSGILRTLPDILGLSYTAGANNVRLILKDSIGNTFFKADSLGQLYILGDADGAADSTAIFINDAAMNIEFSANKTIVDNGFVLASVITQNYGTTVNLSTGSECHVVFSGSTGATTVNITTSAFSVGSILIISDLDRISLTSNITIDVGGGNTIVSLTAAAQTKVIAVSGTSLTLQKVTSTQWMVI